jgi:hypothetical protein
MNMIIARYILYNTTKGEKNYCCSFKMAVHWI